MRLLLLLLLLFAAVCRRVCACVLIAASVCARVRARIAIATRSRAASPLAGVWLGALSSRHLAARNPCSDCSVAGTRRTRSELTRSCSPYSGWDCSTPNHTHSENVRRHSVTNARRVKCSADFPFFNSDRAKHEPKHIQPQLHRVFGDPRSN